MRNNLIILAAALCTMSGCASSATKKAETVQPQEKQAVVPSIQFNADSAYAYVAAQCAFGERVPNTEAHRKCGDYLAGELRRRGAKVTEQNADLKAFDSTVLQFRFRARPQLDEAAFSAMVRACFAQRRKTILNNFASVCGGKDAAAALLQKAGIDPGVRSEQLELSAFLNLFEVYEHENRSECEDQSVA